MKKTIVTAAMIVVAAVAAALAAKGPRVTARAADASEGGLGEGEMTLLGTLEEWNYPGTKMPYGATMGDGGMDGVMSVNCDTILTTPDSFEDVTAFYAKKFGAASPEALGEAGADRADRDAAGDEGRGRGSAGSGETRGRGRPGSPIGPGGEAQSVATQDDSQDRPVKVQVIVVNRGKSATTLVISRAAGEMETHIAWTHHRRFDLGQ